MSENHRLRLARLKRRWSQEEAAEKAQISRKSYNELETGKRIPHLGTLDLLCSAFGASPQELGYNGLGQPLEEMATPPTQAAQQQSASFIVLTGEQAEWVIHLLGLGESAMDQSKRDVLASVLRTRNSVTQPPLPAASFSSTSLTPTYSRRQAIAAIISTTGAALWLSQNIVSSQLHPEETLLLCESHIPLCWSLYFEGGLTEVREYISPYLSHLTLLADDQHSPYRKRSASLASKAYQLACMVALQIPDFGSALMYANQAIQYGSLAGDPNLQVASLVRRALVYFYWKRPQQRLQTYLEALQFKDSISLLLQGRIYMGLAEAYSSLPQPQDYEALQSLELMYNVFPNNPVDDPNFAYTHFKVPQGYEGLVYLNLGRPTQAWDALTLVDKATPKLIIPDRVELTVRQAKACILLGDLRQSASYLSEAVVSARTLGSYLRQKEAYDAYLLMQENWPDEEQVKSLGALFKSAG